MSGSMKIKEYLKRIDPRYLKALAYVLGGVLIVLFITGIVIYNRREKLLAEAVERAKTKAKEEYDLNVSIEKAYFSGINSVTLEKIDAEPQNGEKLLTIEYLEIGVKLWPLLTGNVKVAALNIHDGKLSFVKRDSVSNYSFLFSEKPTDSISDQPTSKMNLAELADKVLNSMLYKIPENMELKDFENTYEDDSTKQKIAIPHASIVNGRLSSTININDNEATWHAVGNLNPDRKQLHFKLYAEGTSVELPLLQKKFGLKLRFDTLETALRNVSLKGSELNVEGGWAVKNLILHHWRISDYNIVVPEGEVNAVVLVGNDYVGLDPKTEVRIKQLKAHPYGKLGFKPNRTIAFGIKMPEIEAQELFDAFPRGMFDNLEGIRVSGKLKYDLDFYVDLDNPDSVQLTAAMQKKDFRINSWGKTNLAKINTPFTYTPYEDGKAMRRIEVGPTNPNFTPINEISPHLKNAILTAEDPSFFSHKGFVEEAFRASIATNIKAKAFRRGGSTISMQLVKNAYLGREKTLARKIEEILMVWLIENNQVVSKQRMFEVYLNIIEWGRNVYGIGEAARYYFDKAPSQLNLGESIYLASIVPKPKTGLYPFQYDGQLRPYLSGYFRLIGGLMARRGLVERDSSSYGFYNVSLKESLRPARPDTVQVDTVKRFDIETEFEETKSFIERLFGTEKKEGNN